MMALPSSNFQPGRAVTTTAVVELAVACRKILDMDVFSKSDPMCVLFVKDLGTDRWREFGRTEAIKNTLNPDFVKRFIIDYIFEERQLLRFEIYDVDSKSIDLKKHDYLGKMECALGEIVSNTKVERPIQGPKRGAGAIIVVAEEQSSCKQQLEMSFWGRKLDKKDWCSNSDPFLAFYRTNNDGSHTLTHKTEVIKNNTNPTWQPFMLSVNKLCFGEISRPILMKCSDWNRDGTEKLIGQVSTSVEELSQHLQGHTWLLINPKYSRKKNYKGSGQLETINQTSLKLNSNKTKLMVFSHNPHPQTLNNQICLGSEPIEQVQCYKYLGVMLDCRLTFTKQAETSALRAKQAVGATMRTFQGSAPRNVLSKVYNVCIKPRLSYAWEACYPKNIHARQKIEKVQRFYAQSYCNRYDLPYSQLLEHYESVSGVKCPPLWLGAAKQRLKLFHNYYHGYRYVPEGRIEAQTQCRRSRRLNHEFHVEQAPCSVATEATFYPVATKLWNALPPNVPGLSSLKFSTYLDSDQFKQIALQFKQHCAL